MSEVGNTVRPIRRFDILFSGAIESNAYLTIHNNSALGKGDWIDVELEGLGYYSKFTVGVEDVEKARIELKTPLFDSVFGKIDQSGEDDINLAISRTKGPFKGKVVIIPGKATVTIAGLEFPFYRVPESRPNQGIIPRKFFNRILR